MQGGGYAGVGEVLLESFSVSRPHYVKMIDGFGPVGFVGDDNAG